MHDDLLNLGWTEDHLSRIRTTVIEEAQRARVLAQALPISGPEEGSTISVPSFTLEDDENELSPPKRRLTVDSEPDLALTTISINVQLRSHEIADPNLTAALAMFRRAANFIARIEDALIVNGRPDLNKPPAGIDKIPEVYTVQTAREVDGLLSVPGSIPVTPAGKPGELVKAVVKAIGELEQGGHGAPFACVLGHELFEISCDPTDSLVLPRDRILPFLQGPLLRSSAFKPEQGVVISLAGNPIEIVVASDIKVRYLQTTLEPRYVFRISERVALRVKEGAAIAVLTK
jgi:encapsulating protein for peroxidase